MRDGTAVLPGDQHGRDIIDGGAGNDTLLGQGDDDQIYGGVGDDKIWGDDCSDWGEKQWILFKLDPIGRAIGTPLV